MVLGPPPTLVEYNNMRFVITNIPESICVEPYIRELVRFNTQKLIKVCDTKYDDSVFIQYGIPIIELVFQDGSFPTAEIIDKWLSIVNNHFNSFPGSALAVQCEYGLGRSPVLIAIALIESGMSSNDAIEFVRSKRRGAFNQLQFDRLKTYCSHGKCHFQYCNIT